VLGELGNDLVRPQPLALRPQGLDQRGPRIQQRHVLVDDLRDARAQDLDGDLAPVVQPREVDLCYRRAGNRHRIEFGKHLVDWPAVGARQCGAHQLRREWRHLVLKLGKLIGDVRRQQVAPRGEHLAELDENRAKCFQRQPQPHGARLRELAPEQQRFDRRAQCPHTLVAEKKFLEPEAQADAENSQQSKPKHAWIYLAVSC